MNWTASVLAAAVGQNSGILIEANSHGVGVFATQDFGPGEAITQFEAEFLDCPTKYTIQIDSRKHLVTEGNVGAFLNHSCDSNTRIVADTLQVVAIRPVRKGDELTFNYLSSEWDMASPFECGCGASDCFGLIRGFRHLTEQERLRVAQLALPYLRREMALPWWIRDEMSVDERGLVWEGTPLAEIVAKQSTPLYLYSGRTMRKRIAELRAAFKSTGAAYRMHYAIKANRFAPILALVRAERDLGIDASSPREVALALESGFTAKEISVTCSMPSRKDFEQFAGYGVHLNLDSFSALKRWGQTKGHHPQVGLRLDPGVALGYGDNPKLSYGNSKFGFPFARAMGAYQFAGEQGLEVDTLHIHVGWGLQQKVEGLLAQVFAQVAALARNMPTLRTINVGGGLCWKQAAQDQPLEITAWSELIKTHLAHLGLTIACESGTYLVASAGVLITEINTVEDRFQQPWIGVDCGHNVNVYAAHYGIPQEIIHVTTPLAQVESEFTIAGNINEANDIFSRSAPLPALKEGDFLAFFPAGAYGASMASDHCLKGLPSEKLIDEVHATAIKVATLGIAS